MNMSDPMITAHSGCEGTGIDTMDSIDQALLCGADAVEIDIRLDPLGGIRISHDPLSLEDYLRKNPLADVFRKVLPTSLLINFDLKEEAALYKTVNAAHDFGFPTERLIFTGCTTPDHLTGDPELTHRANFFLNIAAVLKYVYAHRKEEIGREVFSALMEDPYIIFIDEAGSIPDVYLTEAVKLREKICAVSRSLKEKIFEDTISIFRETHAAAANMPKQLLWTSIAETLKAGNVPLSVWTVNEPEIVRRCLDFGVRNITTRKIRLTKQILAEHSAQHGTGHPVLSE